MHNLILKHCLVRLVRNTTGRCYPELQLLLYFLCSNGVFRFFIRAFYECSNHIYIKNKSIASCYSFAQHKTTQDYFLLSFHPGLSNVSIQHFSFYFSLFSLILDYVLLYKLEVAVVVQSDFHFLLFQYKFQKA
jgi:hypothetical protein